MGKQLTEQELLRIGELNDSIVSGRLGATSEEKARARNELEVALHGNLEALVENARRGLRAGGLEKALSEMVEGVADAWGTTRFVNRFTAVCGSARSSLVKPGCETSRPRKA